MSKCWASTLIETITKPVSIITDIVDTIAGTPEHQRFSNMVKTDVFKDSHYRKLDNISNDTSLHPGFVLRVSRGTYWHYGVYVGNDEVVHFTSENDDTSSNNSVMKTSTQRFIRNAKNIEILGFPDKVEGKPIFSREATCSRALSKIGFDNYSITGNNCQHFAFWCKTGIAYSGQTYLYNGGYSNEYPNAGSSNQFQSALGGLLPDALVPDLVGRMGIEVLRIIFASNYTPK